MRKKVLIAASALAGLLVIAVLGLFLFLDANQFRPELENAMGGALGRKVSIGNITVAPFSGGIVVEDLSIADDPAFSTAPFVTAKAVTVGVDLMPLIFSKSLRVQTFRLEEPHVVLLSSESGQWNFSGLSGTPSDAPSSGSSAAMSVLIQKIEIANGRITVASREPSTLPQGQGRPGQGRATTGSTSSRTQPGENAPGRQSVYDNVNLEVRNLSFTSQFPFLLTTKTPGGGTVTLDGQAGPFNTSDAALTPFHATVVVADLDVASTGFVDPASGLSGTIDFKGDLASDGQQLASKGQVTATGFRLVPGGTPAKVPIQIDYESSYARKQQTGVVKQGDVHIGKAVAHLTGDYDAAGEMVVLRMKLSGDKMPASDLEATLPAIGVALPPGASLRNGTLDVNVSIAGPVDRLVIAGPVNLSNVTVAGFDLGGKLSALPSFGGVSKSPGNNDTLIQTLAATLRVAPDGIRADNVNMVAPAIGSLTGSGTITPKNELDFKMLAKLIGSGAAGQVSNIVSLGQPANGIPFRVTGTTANPVFVPEVRRAVGDAAKGLLKDPESAKKAASALGGLFGGKKR